MPIDENPDYSPVKLISDDYYRVLEGAQDTIISLSASDYAKLLKSIEVAYITAFDFMRSAALANVGEVDAANELKDKTIASWTEGAHAFQMLATNVASPVNKS